MHIEQYFYQEKDATKFSNEAAITNIIILLCFGLAFFTNTNLLLLAIIINIALVRWMLAVHELFHIQDHEQVNKFVRLILIPFSPINIGYKEYRTLHMAHHKQTATEKDPDAFHIRGGHLRSFFGAFFFPEGSTIGYLKNHHNEVNWNLVVLRFVFFIAMAYIGGAVFWLAWFILRVNYAISVWVFFHHLHYRNGDYGSFELPLPEWLKSGFILIYGKPAVMATMHHDIHHLYPRVAAVNLDKLSSRATLETSASPG